MNRMLSRTGLGAAVVTTAFGGLTGIAQAKVVKGTVVHHDKRAHSFVVANAAGELMAIHASHAPRLGSKVTINASRLADGTYKLQHAAVAGRVKRVRIHGVVTYVSRRTGSFTLSVPGASLVVHTRRSGRAGRVADGPPRVGSDVTATATIDDQGELDDDSLQTTAPSSSDIALEGTVLSVDPTAGTLTISADDEDESRAGLTVTVPSTLDIAQFTVGEEAELHVQLQADGSYLLLGSADDDNAQSANDHSDEQGDQGGDDHHQQPGDNGGDGQDD